MKFLESLKKDFLCKELASVKILMFLIYGGQATLYPYFSVHLKSLGVSIEQTSIIFAIQPIVALIIAPMVGMLADRIGNFKFIFCFFLIFSAITSNTLLLVPPIKETFMLYRADCDGNANYETTHFKLENIICNNPNMNLKFRNFSLNMQFLHCRSSCSRDSDEHNDTSITFIKENIPISDCRDPTNPYCRKIDSGTHFTASIYVHEKNNETIFVDIKNVQYDNDTYQLAMCQNMEELCHNMCLFKSDAPEEICQMDDNNPDFGVTFWIYLGIRLIVTLGIGLVNGLFDAASMAIVQKLRADVGYQRFWATISMCIFAPVSGLLVDHYGGSFKPCFFMYGALYTMAAIASLFLDLSMKLPSDDAFANLVNLLKNPEVPVMLLNVAALGICWGFLENFLFWFLESELQASNFLMGLTVTVGSGTGLFMTLISTWCTRKLGYINVMVLAFAAYTVRYIGYSKAQTAYECLIFEMMENFTVTLLTVGVTLYCAELASMKMLTTMMTLWNGLHVVSGRAFGSLLGGFLMARVGFRKTFMYFSYGSASFGIAYALLNVFWLRERRKRLESDPLNGKRRTSGVSATSQEEDEAYAQAMRSTTLQCSSDSPVFITYLSDIPQQCPRRRAMSHIGLRETRNSLRGISVIPRHVKSFSGRTTECLPTVFETGNEMDITYDENAIPRLDPEGAEADVSTEAVTRL